jgi:hypothetical protein
MTRTTLPPLLPGGRPTGTSVVRPWDKSRGGQPTSPSRGESRGGRPTSPTRGRGTKHPGDMKIYRLKTGKCGITLRGDDTTLDGWKADDWQPASPNQVFNMVVRKGFTQATSVIKTQRPGIRSEQRRTAYDMIGFMRVMNDGQGKLQSNEEIHVQFGDDPDEFHFGGGAHAKKNAAINPIPVKVRSRNAPRKRIITKHPGASTKNASRNKKGAHV